MQDKQIISMLRDPINMRFDQITTEAMQLSPNQRALLLASLRESLVDESSEDLDEAGTLALAMDRKQIADSEVQQLSAQSDQNTSMLPFWYNPKLWIVIILVLVALFVRAELRSRNYRDVILDRMTRFQMETIENRARDFMEIKLNQRTVSGGWSISEDSYELTIKVPDDARKEFVEWMKESKLQPVQIDGWPSSRGAQSFATTNELVYRVYYGKEPSDWN
jgi:hypothetical protein